MLYLRHVAIAAFSLVVACNLLLTFRIKPSNIGIRAYQPKIYPVLSNISADEGLAPVALHVTNLNFSHLETGNVDVNPVIEAEKMLLTRLNELAVSPPAECSRDNIGYVDWDDKKRKLMCVPRLVCSQSMGNCLARYYEARAFAQGNGMDFIMKKGRDDEESPSFLDELPTAVLAEKPFIGNVGSFNDGCLHACSNAEFPQIWLKIKREFASALSKWFGNDNLQPPPMSESVIYIRCGDILQYAHHSEYGYLPYSAYRALVPPDSKRIAIIASPMKNPRRPTDELHRQECLALYDDLQLWLRENFPQADVQLLSDEPVSHSIYRMVFSKVLICNPSTFCLWPGIAAQGKAFMPKTPLFLGGTAPFLGDHVEWRDFRFLSPTKYIHELGSDIKRAIAHLREN